MSLQSHWRLAMMFDAPNGDLERLAQAMMRGRMAISAAAREHPVRLGIADRHPSLFAGIVADWRGVDGALEITVANEAVVDLPDICHALRPVLAKFVDISSVEVMAGPMFPMVPICEGRSFLSLAFRRDPKTTAEAFRHWWLKQHSQIAIPVLGPELLAYDQVHVDQAASKLLSDAFGVPHVEYDAYDNLTYASLSSFLESCSRDPEGMAGVVEDEMGRIDNTSRRRALMQVVG